MTLRLTLIYFLIVTLSVDIFSQNLTADEKVVFNQVAFSRKKVGDYELIYKWTTPIKYKVYGDADNYLLKEIDNIFNQISQLTKLEFAKAESDEGINYIIVIGKKDSDITRLSASFRNHLNSLGYTSFRTNSKSEITKAENLLIAEKYPDKASVKSSIIKNIIKSIGFFQRTTLIKNSLFYEKNIGITKIDDFDAHIISQLYSPLIKPGMDKDQVEVIIGK